MQVVATTRDNVSPSFVLEFLRRICTIIKDYCGLLTEEAIRKNFVLIYELLDEVIDYGVPQSTSTDALKTFVLNEPVVVAPQVGFGLGRQHGPGLCQACAPCCAVSVPLPAGRMCTGGPCSSRSSSRHAALCKRSAA